jgi:hypothetical protein
MERKDLDNAASVLVAIQLQITAVLHDEQNAGQCLANIQRICELVCPKLNLPEATI